MDEKLLEMIANVSKSLEALTAAVGAKPENGTEQKESHEKTPANFSNYTPLHGSGGIFAVNGLERDIITAHVRPFGLAEQLPLIPSVFVDPRFGAITGYTDVVGNQPTYVCEDAPYGYMKSCTLTARFGKLRFDTNTIDMDDVMLRLHRGDFTDLILRGRVLGMGNIDPAGMNQDQILNVVTMAEMVTVAVNTERALNTQLWQGVLGTQNQFPGLDVQIATGQSDAETGTLCPALDSDVKDFAYDDIAGAGRSIVEYLSMLEYYIYNNAETMGLLPAEWVFVMRPQLFFELTAVWPCQYNTTKCSPTVAANSTVFIDGRDNTAERDAMRAGKYIDINGRRYRVVTDTGIFEHNNINNGNLIPGQYASSIYMVPLTVTGGFPVTYREYVDYTKAQPDIALLRNLETFWTDRGVYSWALEQVKWCYKLSLKTEQRVVLRAPHLAGRIDHVRYSPLQHLRDADPDSPYWADGGVSLRGGLSDPFAVWSGRQ